ncbi:MULTISPECIES: hypothetical protein [Arthrobacter]|nr:MULTISPECIES: hypothetical protein [Arthrobacter]
MVDERRPRANAWQIAGIWTSAAGLVLAAAKPVLDLWHATGQ